MVMSFQRMVFVIFPVFLSLYFTDVSQPEKLDLVLEKVEVVAGGKTLESKDLNISNRYKVVTVIGAESVDYTLILNRMKELIEEVGVHNHYSFLIFVEGKDAGSANLQVGGEGLQSWFPLLLDPQYIFRNTNAELVGQGSYTTFLLDRDDRVIKKDLAFSDDFFDRVIEHAATQPRFIDNPPKHRIINQ
jgi:hypothetical protein